MFTPRFTPATEESAMTEHHRRPEAKPQRRRSGPAQHRAVPRFTILYLDNLQPDPTQDYERSEMSGLRIAVRKTGGKTLIGRYRRPGDPRKQARLTIAAWPESDDEKKGVLANARSVWAAAKLDIQKRKDPGLAKLANKATATSQARNTLRVICDDWLSRKTHLASHDEIKDRLEQHVYPMLGDRAISTLKKLDGITLFETIEKNSGHTMALRTYGYVKTILKWRAGRDDSFASPFAALTFEDKTEARTRTLSDDEIRRIWPVLETMGVFGGVMRMLLLTTARREEVTHMRWCELVVDPQTSAVDWILPASRNRKTKQDLVRTLSPAALAIIRVQAVNAWLCGYRCPFVFTLNGRTPLADIHLAKQKLEKAAGAHDWRTHDLRRSGRTLLSRAGVLPDHGERCLGHAVGGIRKVYDRYEFYNEKKQAFLLLAALIDRIVRPLADNVKALRAG